MLADIRGLHGVTGGYRWKLHGNTIDSRVEPSTLLSMATQRVYSWYTEGLQLNLLSCPSPYVVHVCVCVCVCVCVRERAETARFSGFDRVGGSVSLWVGVHPVQ